MTSAVETEPTPFPMWLFTTVVPKSGGRVEFRMDFDDPEPFQVYPLFSWVLMHDSDLIHEPFLLPEVEIWDGDSYGGSYNVGDLFVAPYPCVTVFCDPSEIPTEPWGFSIGAYYLPVRVVAEATSDAI